MGTLKLTISYDGSAYSGWQTQANGTTIQETIERAVSSVVGAPVSVIGSGRTDAGTHARGQVAHVRTSTRLSLAKLLAAVNSALPRDILVTEIKRAPQGFHAQHSARSKVYRYTIFNADFVDPFMRHFAAKCFYRLDVRQMRRAAAHLRGRHDFASFQASGAAGQSTVRTVRALSITRRGDLVIIDIEADGFLYNMVRKIVGTLIDVGRGKRKAADIVPMMEERDPRSSGPTAPAHGLCLMKVRY